MDTEIYDEKPKNKPSIDLEKIEKIAKPIVRVLLTLILWVVILALFTVVSGIFALSGSAIPGFLFFIPIIIGGIASVIIWNEEIYQNIKHKIQEKISTEIQGNISGQIAQEFKKLKPEELQEIRQGIAKLKDTFGLDIQLPTEKRKRDQIDAVISRLSDSQLLELKEGINGGSIQEDDLYDWLSQQEELGQQNQ